VQPGQHAFDGYDVVWWDPAALRLGAQPRFGVRKEELLGKSAPRALIDANLRRFREWQGEREAAIAGGARPGHVVCTATARAAEPAEAGVAVEVVELPRATPRPGGSRFGALVHAVLASAPLGGSADEVQQAAVVQSRVLGASDAELAAAVHAVAAALAHPLLRHAAVAATAGGCRRETPITLQAADGTIVEGAVDLAFLEDGTWTVIDFKTDQELTRNLDAYRRQVGLYAHAIAAATGMHARAVLLRV
jgi:ATP-dependent exoDNAse (exonuclease V) beta subunit